MGCPELLPESGLSRIVTDPTTVSWTRSPFDAGTRITVA